MDKEIVEILSNLIKRVSLNQIHIWFSNDRRVEGGFAIGENWFDTIISHLEQSQGTIAFITPNSNNQPWLLYEAGFAEANKGNTLIPLKFLIALDKISTPIQHKQIFGVSNNEEANIFISKLLNTFHINYDKEAFQDIVEKSIKEMREKYKPATTPIPQFNSQNNIAPNYAISLLEKKMDVYFSTIVRNLEMKESYEIAIEYAGDKGNIIKDFVRIENETMISDVLDQVYYFVDYKITPFRYLETWILKCKFEERYLVISDFQNIIPAKVVFLPHSEWEVIFLDKPYSPDNSYNKNNNIIKF